PSASTTPSPPSRNTASGAAPPNRSADKSASKEGSTSEQNPPAERSPDTATTRTATNPPAPNAKPRWPDTRHAENGSRTPSGKRPRHENKTPHRRRPRRPANHPRMQGRIGANAPPTTHAQPRPAHRKDAVFQVANPRKGDRGTPRALGGGVVTDLTVEQLPKGWRYRIGPLEVLFDFMSATARGVEAWIEVRLDGSDVPEIFGRKDLTG